MKIRILVLLLALLLLTACGKGNQPSAAPTQVVPSASKSTPSVSATAPAANPEKRSAQLFFWENRAISPVLDCHVEDVTFSGEPQALVDLLIQRAALPDGTRILSFRRGDAEITADTPMSDKYLEASMDVSAAFGEAYRNAAAADRCILVANLLSPMYDSYCLRSIRLTCAGEPLEGFSEPISFDFRGQLNQNFDGPAEAAAAFGTLYFGGAADSLDVDRAQTLSTGETDPELTVCFVPHYAGMRVTLYRLDEEGLPDSNAVFSIVSDTSSYYRFPIFIPEGAARYRLSLRAENGNCLVYDFSYNGRYGTPDTLNLCLTADDAQFAQVFAAVEENYLHTTADPAAMQPELMDSVILNGLDYRIYRLTLSDGITYEIAVNLSASCAFFCYYDENTDLWSLGAPLVPEYRESAG